VLALFLIGVMLEASTSRAQRPVEHTAGTLKHSALHTCGPAVGTRPVQTIRVATWNIHSARSAPLAQIADDIRQTGADVIALQEVDRHARRTGSVDQAVTLAAMLEFHYAYAASVQLGGGDYGLAVLSRWPLTDVVRHRVGPAGDGEPRIILEVVVCALGRRLRLLNHHADTSPAARQQNLAGLNDVVRARNGDPTIVLGDFNSRPDDHGIRALLDSGFVDPAAGPDTPTNGEGRIDYLLVDRSLAEAVQDSRVWKSSRSDHDALVAALTW
jgi:endonuclease/exonuclease/phosphatase family metal-dependent hydrolase